MQGDTNELLSNGQTLSEDSAAPLEGQPAGRGGKVAMAVVLIGILGVGGLLGMRVKQALARKDVLATERAAAQAAIQKKPPADIAHPAPARWTPRVEMTGTLRPWREGDV